MAKLLRWSISTTLVGALFGFVVTSLAGPVLDESGWFGTAGESTQSRAYMVGMLENEPETLVSLTPKNDVVSRAAMYKQSEAALGQWKPVTLTFLGGKSSGSFNVQIYAIEMRNARGREQFIPLALTLRGGKVVRRE